MCQFLKTIVPPVLAATMLSGCFASTSTLIEPLKGHYKMTDATSNASQAAERPAEVETLPRVLKSGVFRPVTHDVAGTAMIIETPEGLVLRLEDFYTTNAFDLLLTLVRNPEGTIRGSEDYLDLGRLKSTNGSMNYLLPAGTDISQFKSVNIWCRALNVNFGVATFQ